MFNKFHIRKRITFSLIVGFVALWTFLEFSLPRNRMITIVNDIEQAVITDN